MLTAVQRIADFDKAIGPGEKHPGSDTHTNKLLANQLACYIKDTAANANTSILAHIL